MVSNLGLALLRDFASCVVRPWSAHGNAPTLTLDSGMNQVSQRCTPLYRLLEFCNLLIRGLLPEVLIAEPCINFSRWREGFSAGEGCEVEQTAREVAVLPRVLWCEFPWLIRLVALAIILGGPFVGVLGDSRAAGRRRVWWECLGFSLAGLRWAKGPVDFANASLGPFTRPTIL
jgi:hypothetical protein